MKSKVLIGNERRVEVMAIGTVRLKLNFVFCLEIDNVVYVPYIRMKLVSFRSWFCLFFYFTLNNKGLNNFFFFNISSH